MKKHVFYLFALFLLIFGTPCFAEKGEIQGFGMGTGIGLRLNYDEERMKDVYHEMKELGVRWTREEFRTEEADNDYFYQDNLKMLEIIKKNGIEVTGVIDYGINQHGVSDQEFLKQWKKKVERIVKEFGPYVSVWEIGNQMNIAEFWKKVRPESDSVDPDLYSAMYKEAQKIIRKHDKSAKVSIGALSAFIGSNDLPPLSYLTKICKNIKSNTVDAISIHAPMGPYFPEDDQSVNFGYLDERIVNMKTYLEAMIDGLKNNCRWDKEIIVSAVGYREQDLQKMQEKTSVPLDRIEAYALSRIYPSFLSIPQVSAVYWYTMVPDEQGESVISQNARVAYLDTAVRLGNSIPLGQFDALDPDGNALLGISQYRFRHEDDLIISFWANQPQFETQQALFIGTEPKTLTNIPLSFIGERVISDEIIVGEDTVEIGAIANYVFGSYSDDLRLMIKKPTTEGELSGDGKLALTETGAIRNLDGMEMVFVPAGEFTMGADSGWNDDYSPAHSVYLDDYWIDKYEVSNDQYRKCIEAGVCSNHIGFDNSKYFFENEKYGNYPLTVIFWEDAKKYCEWVGASLPSEAQWEKAARGTDEREYPWGENHDFQFPADAKANFDFDDCWRTPDEIEDKDGYCFTAPVDSYPQGASPYGAFNMVGNAQEWVNDFYSEDYYSVSPKTNPTGPETGSNHVLRGGSFLSPYWSGDQILRRTYASGSSGIEDGFRCTISKENPNFIPHPDMKPIEMKSKRINEMEAAQSVYNYLFDWLLRHTSPTDEENVYITQNGSLIKVLEQDPLPPSETLSDADIANGMVWNNFIYIKSITKLSSHGQNEWKDKKLFFNKYRAYSDGTIRTDYWNGPAYEDFELVDGLLVIDGEEDDLFIRE